MKIKIGIDCGVNTGFAVAIDGILTRVESMTITQAMEAVKELHKQHPNLIVRIEDARKRTWFGNADARQAKSGAGTREGVGSLSAIVRYGSNSVSSKTLSLIWYIQQQT
jgi:hypothetical protein